MSASPTDPNIVDVTAALAEEAPGTPPEELLARGRDASTPLQIPRRGWKDIALRVKDEWGDDHVGLSAAGVAFYAFLAMIPALAAMVSILGLTSKGDDATEVIDDLFGALPTSARELLSTQLESIIASSSGSLSVGLVIGHVGPEAALGGPIAFIEEGDEIVADLNTNELNCTALNDPAVLAKRKAAWEKVVADHGGVNPNCGIADTRLLHRARHTAVPATRGGGMHPNREVWVREERSADRSGFSPKNKFRPGTDKTF